MPARQTITAIPIRKSLFGYGTEVSTPTSGGRTGHGNRSSGTGGSTPFLRRRRRAASRSASARGWSGGVIRLRLAQPVDGQTELTIPILQRFPLSSPFETLLRRCPWPRLSFPSTPGSANRLRRPSLLDEGFRLIPRESPKASLRSDRRTERSSQPRRPGRAPGSLPSIGRPFPESIQKGA